MRRANFYHLMRVVGLVEQTLMMSCPEYSGYSDIRRLAWATVKHLQKPVPKTLLSGFGRRVLGKSGVRAFGGGGG